MSIPYPVIKSYSVYNDPACVYISRGEFQEVLDFCIKAYKINVSMHGLNHSHTQDSCEDIKLIFFECNPEGNFVQWMEEKMKE